MVNIQFWQVSGYEANADIEDEPVPPGVLHRGVNTSDGAGVWVYWHEELGRWQEVDPSMSAATYGNEARDSGATG